VRRVLVWLVMVLVFLMLLGFALKNLDSVTVRYFLGLEWQAPLVLVLLIFFALGIALGLAASFGVIFAQRRTIAGLKRERRGEAAGAPPAAPGAA
jgi:uncharacterized integral membrane protein